MRTFSLILALSVSLLILGGCLNGMSRTDFGPNLGLSMDLDFSGVELLMRYGSPLCDTASKLAARESKDLLSLAGETLRVEGCAPRPMPPDAKHELLRLRSTQKGWSDAEIELHCWGEKDLEEACENAIARAGEFDFQTPAEFYLVLRPRDNTPASEIHLLLSAQAREDEPREVLFRVLSATQQ